MDERLRGFEREAQRAGMSVERYLQVQVARDPDRFVPLMQRLIAQQTDRSVALFVYWDDLAGSDLWEHGFGSFSYGDAALTLVDASQVLAELEHMDAPEPLLDVVRQLDEENTLIGFAG